MDNPIWEVGFKGASIGILPGYHAAHSTEFLAGINPVHQQRSHLAGLRTALALISDQMLRLAEQQSPDRQAGSWLIERGFVKSIDA
jgi:hypothetical protein